LSNQSGFSNLTGARQNLDEARRLLQSRQKRLQLGSVEHFHILLKVLSKITDLNEYFS
jgi:hypothetical protein